MDSLRDRFRYRADRPPSATAMLGMSGYTCGARDAGLFAAQADGYRETGVRA